MRYVLTCRCGESLMTNDPGRKFIWLIAHKYGKKCDPVVVKGGQGDEEKTIPPAIYKS